jgi:hypothetical protein
VAHLEVIGARAYVLNKKLPRRAKLESRALISHLVGFDSTNIFRVWLLTIGRVIQTQDAVFSRGKLCNSQGQYAEKSYIQEAAEVLDIKETLNYSNILAEQLSYYKEREAKSQIRDTIHVQPQSINQQDHTQQKDTGALITLEATLEVEEPTQLTG